jgi:hypothetical protein
VIETEYGCCGREDEHEEHQTAKREGAPLVEEGGAPQRNIIWQKICLGVEPTEGGTIA